MNRAFLRWFYIGVQFVMLAVSIPKVAMLFHAYDTETMGPLIGGVDLRSWLVGVAIDLTATFTTWAAMAKYDESRKRSALIAPAIIILFCTSLSVIANYEDAATRHPEQYAHIALFSDPALLVNPILISAPPILVLLLILLVPSVLAQPRIKSAAEIEAEAEEEEARIAADARIRQARAKANASVMAVRLHGLRETVHSLNAVPEEPEEPLPQEFQEPNDSQPLPAPPRMTRALWQAMKLPERVQQSGVITAQEVAEVLDISLSHARNLTRDVTSGTQRLEGRSGVSYNDLIESLYDSRGKDSYARARKLEMALGVRKRVRTLQAVTGDELEEVSGSGGE